MKKKIVLGSVILLFLSVSLAVTRINIAKLQAYLSESHKISANLLIIESWLPNVAFDMANSEIRQNNYDIIVTTGVKSSDLDYCMVPQNGYLIFFPNFKSLKYEAPRRHLIEIVAHSEMNGKYSTHVNFFVNDSLVTDLIINKKKRKYAINWMGSLKAIDSLMIHFDNDMIDDFGDRNLYVKEVIIDKRIKIPYRFNSIYDIGLIGGQNRINNNYDSRPENARNRLIERGLDSSKVIVITGEKTNFNRTLASALAFRSWLKTTQYKATGINIITMGIHGQRTWLTYKKVLGKSYKVGIISLPEKKSASSDTYTSFKIIREFLELIYYRIILIPWQVF